jgi:hypothetical protein
MGLKPERCLELFFFKNFVHPLLCRSRAFQRYLVHGGGHHGFGRSGHDKQNKQTNYLSVYFTCYETLSFP